MKISSPELDLLETLSGQDESLFVVSQIFSTSSGEAAFERARHAVTMQIEAGKIVLVEKTSCSERVLESWRMREVLADKTNWLKDAAPYYFLQLL